MSDVGFATAAREKTLEPPRKKRKLEEVPEVLTANTQTAPTILRGKPFIKNINRLAEHETPKVSSVTTRLNIPYLAGTAVGTAQSKTVSTFGTFSVLPRYGDKEWTQGLLSPFGSTSYFDAQYTTKNVPVKSKSKTPGAKPKTRKVKIGGSVEGRAVPLTMSLGKATIESRTMKFLAMRQSRYDPTAKPRDQKVLVPDDKSQDYLGGLAMGSYLEEITARRGLSIQHVGSAMRATTLASKWRMQTDSQTTETGFGKKMLTDFPQLGKGELLDAVHKFGGWTGFPTDAGGSRC